MHVASEVTTLWRYTNMLIIIINVKKLQFIHMLMATDLRKSKTAKIKKLYYDITAHRRTSMCSSIVKTFFYFCCFRFAKVCRR